MACYRAVLLGWALLQGHWAPLLGHWAPLLGHWIPLLGDCTLLLGEYVVLLNHWSQQLDTINSSTYVQWSRELHMHYCCSRYYCWTTGPSFWASGPYSWWATGRLCWTWTLVVPSSMVYVSPTVLSHWTLLVRTAIYGAKSKSNTPVVQPSGSAVEPSAPAAVPSDPTVESSSTDGTVAQQYDLGAHQ